MTKLPKIKFEIGEVAAEADKNEDEEDQSSPWLGRLRGNTSQFDDKSKFNSDGNSRYIRTHVLCIVRSEGIEVTLTPLISEQFPSFVVHERQDCNTEMGVSAHPRDSVTESQPEMRRAKSINQFAIRKIVTNMRPKEAYVFNFSQHS